MYPAEDAAEFFSFLSKSCNRKVQRLDLFMHELDFFIQFLEHVIEPLDWQSQFSDLLIHRLDDAVRDFDFPTAVFPV